MIDRNSPLPLYYQLAEHIKSQVESGAIKPGDKLPSESEMIELYGIGRLTIRQALSQLVNAGYLHKVHGKGTFCRETAAQGSRVNIDVILDMSFTYFTPYLIKGISHVLSANNCNFIIHDSKHDSLVIGDLLIGILGKGTSGLILQPSRITGEVSESLRHSFMQLRGAGIPYIMIDSVYEGVDTSYIILDDYKGGCLGARYFAELGHRHMGVVYMDDYKDSLLRRSGFAKTCEIMGLPKPVAILYESGFVDKLYEAVRHDRITALFCYNDQVALECISHLKAYGLAIPGNISVLGFDDSIIATATSPQLSTIAHPKQVMGEQAAGALLELIKKNRLWPYTSVFDPILIRRGSCAPPPAY